LLAFLDAQFGLFQKDGDQAIERIHLVGRQVPSVRGRAAKFLQKASRLGIQKRD